MDAPWPAREALWQPIDVSVARRLSGATATSLWLLLSVAGVFVLARRAGGALNEPLPSAILVAAAVVLAAAAIAFRRLIVPAIDGAHPVARYGVWSAPAGVLLVWALGLLLPGTSAVGAIGFLGLLVVEEAWSWWRLLPARPAKVAAAYCDPEVSAESLASERPAAIVPQALRLDQAAVAESGAVGVLDRPSADLESGASQWMVRRREEGGGETIEGWVRAGFVASERHANAHLAICPPLARTPVCYAEQSDGPPAQVKVAQVLPYGVRIEIKLDQPASEPCEVTVEFSIHEQPEA